MAGLIGSTWRSGHLRERTARQAWHIGGLFFNEWSQLARSVQNLRKRFSP
jgi:hypothetical protein